MKGMAIAHGFYGFDIRGLGIASLVELVCYLAHVGLISRADKQKAMESRLALYRAARKAWPTYRNTLGKIPLYPELERDA